MKKIRQISENPYVILMVLFNFIFVSCNRDEIVTDNLSAKTKSSNTLRISQYSDIDVFKGIMFLEGPVAEEFPDFQELNFRNFMADDSQVENVSDTLDKLIDQILIDNPDYLKTFRRNISSGDYYLVQQTVVDAAELIKEKIMQMLNKSEEPFTADSATNFMQENNLSPNSSIEEIIKTVKNSSKLQAGSSTYVDTDTFLYSAVAVAGVVILVGVIVAFLAAPLIDDGSSSPSKYMTDKYISDITIQLNGIN